MDATRRKLRYAIFTVLSLVFVVGFVLNDYYNWHDECLVQYAATAIISLTCFGLFVHWWVKMGKASEVYMWTTMLLLTMAYSSYVMYQARWIFVYLGPEYYKEFITSSLWYWRQIPRIIVLLYLLSLIVSRMVVQVKENGE